jgi:hypothetical protein
MLDKTIPISPVQLVDGDGKELGLGLRLTCGVGQHRQLDMSFGVPLSWSVDEINTQVDKLIAVVERQAAKGDLLSIKGTLQTLEMQLETTRQQMVNHETNARAAWYDAKKHGEFKLTGQAATQMQNFQNTEQTQIAAIKKLREELKVVEERCR